MKARSGIFAAAVLAAATLSTVAEAHTGAGAATGPWHGFLHPFSGADHVLAMFAVGLFAYLLKGRALWLVPLSFVAMMAAGGALGSLDAGLPLVETGIALSLVAIGGLVALGRSIPVAAAMATVGLFAIFHGQAHGSEMPATVSGLGYGIGFLAATALIHAAGIGGGFLSARLAGGRLLRTGGALVAGAGLLLLGGAV